MLVVNVNFVIQFPIMRFHVPMPVPPIVFGPRACSGGTLELGAPMENGIGARSANVEIVWSGLNCGILSERGALFDSEMESERGARRSPGF